jgi:hypothetical protein
MNMYEDYGERWETGGKYRKNTGHTSENIIGNLWENYRKTGKVLKEQYEKYGKHMGNNGKLTGNAWKNMRTNLGIYVKIWETMETYGKMVIE